MFDSNGGSGLRGTVGGVALIEISSNNISFSARYFEEDSSHKNFTLKRRAGLGRSPEGTNILNPEGKDIAKDALRTWHKDIIDETPFDAIAYVATGVLRRADDAQDFLDELEEEFGFRAEILSGKQEARYSARAVGKPGIIIDQGGDSCEFAIMRKGGRIIKPRSLPLGAFKIMEQGNDADAYTRKHIESLPKEYQSGAHGQLHIVGGGPRSVLRSYRKTIGQPAGAFTSGVSALELAEHAMTLKTTQADRQTLSHVFYVKDKRLETIQANALLLNHLIDEFGVSIVVPSKAGLRDAILDELSEHSRKFWFDPDIGSNVKVDFS